jgi:hypothetical protein
MKVFVLLGNAYLEIGHYHLLPNPYQLTIHDLLFSLYATFAVETASANNLIINQLTVELILCTTQ